MSYVVELLPNGRFRAWPLTGPVRIGYGRTREAAVLEARRAQ